MKKILPGLAVLVKAVMLFVLLTNFSGQASAQTPAYIQEFNNYFEDNLYKYNNEGLTVIIGCADRILYTNSWRTIDTSSQVAVASISKWLTSAIIMTLVEEHKFDLDDRVGEYIDSWDANGKQNVTIRQLLSHTSGVAVDNTDVDDNGGITLDSAVNAIALKPLLFSPGSQYLYGTSAYKVASRVAEVVEEKLWKEIFAERFKTVCGMPNADFNPLWINNPSTGAGLSVRANEYANFLRMILRHGMHNSTRVMDSASIVEMEAYSSQASQFDTYGLGVHREQIDTSTGIARELMHPGATGTLAWVDRNKGYYGVILSSSGMGAVNSTNQFFREWARTKIPDNECGNTTPPPSCNFNITASNSISGSNLSLISSCSGADCSGVTYAWSGNGASSSSSSTTVTKPTTAGNYTYIITASKSGCSNKTASTTYIVDGGGGSTTCVNYDDECSGNSSEIRSRNISVSGAGSYSFKIHARSHERPSIGRIRINGGSWSTFNLAQTGVSEYAERSIGSFSLNNGSNTVEFASGDGYICYRDLCVTGGNGGECTTPAAPTLGANPATITTLGGSSTLTASGCVSGGTITWSTGSTNSSITVTPSSQTTYTATCSKDGCTSSPASVTVNVDINPGGNPVCVNLSDLCSGNSSEIRSYSITTASSGTYGLKLIYKSHESPGTGRIRINNGTWQTFSLAQTNIGQYVETTIGNYSLSNGSNSIDFASGSGYICFRQLCAQPGGNPLLLETIPEEFTTIKKGLLVSPNPNKGIFETNFYLEKGKKATLVIIDLQGRIIHRQAVVGRGQHREKINILNKTSGTLILQLQKENGIELKKINIAR